MTNRIGINVLLNHVDRNRITTRLKSLNPSLVVATVDNDSDMKLIHELRGQLPNTLVIGRVYIEKTDGAFHTKPADDRYWLASPEDCLNRWGELGKKGGVLYLLNEPGTADDVNVARLVNWAIEVIENAHQRGIRLCILNFSTGTPIVKNGEWDERFDPVLRMLSKYREMLLGCHEYDPGDVDRTGRIEAMFARCKTLGVRPPNVGLTETGYDKGDGEPDNLNGYKSRKITGKQLATRRKTVWRNIYSKYPEIVGEAVFCAGKTWPNFDVQDDDEFWRELESDPVTSAPPPVIQPIPNPPLPAILGDPREIKIDGEWTLRSEADKDSPKIGLLKDEYVDIYPITATSADGYVFHVAKRKSTPFGEASAGWTATPIPDIPPSKPPAPILLTPHITVTVTLPAGITPELEKALRENITIEFKKSA